MKQAAPRRHHTTEEKWWVFSCVDKELSGRWLGAGEMVKIQSNVIYTNKKKAKDGKTGKRNIY